MACFYSAPLAWNPTGVDSSGTGFSDQGEIERYSHIPAPVGCGYVSRRKLLISNHEQRRSARLTWRMRTESVQAVSIHIYHFTVDRGRLVHSNLSHRLLFG